MWPCGPWDNPAGSSASLVRRVFYIWSESNPRNGGTSTSRPLAPAWAPSTVGWPDSRWLCNLPLSHFRTITYWSHSTLFAEKRRCVPCRHPVRMASYRGRPAYGSV